MPFNKDVWNIKHFRHFSSCAIMPTTFSYESMVIRSIGECPQTAIKKFNLLTKLMMEWVL